jgi:hypothetical protein
MSDAQWESQKNNMASSQAQIEIIKNMGGEWRKLSQVLAQLGMDLTEQTSPALANLAKVMSENLAVMERGGVFKTLAEWMGNLALMADALGLSIEQIGEAMFKIHDKFSITLPSVSGLTGAGASMTQQNTITIAVNGAESGPAGIAQQIAREIEHVLKKTAYQDGGKRL